MFEDNSPKQAVDVGSFVWFTLTNYSGGIMLNWEDMLRVNVQLEQKRGKKRFPYLYFTRYSVKNENKNVKNAAIDNISESGACMLIPEQLKEGEVVLVEIPLSHVETSVRTLAEVVWSIPIPFWSQGSFIGLRFLI